MLPIRDDNPTTITSFVNWALIGLAAITFFFIQPGDAADSFRFLFAQATIPCEVITAEPLSVSEIETGECTRGGQPAFPDKSVLRSLVVAIFLHGSFGHLLGNLWILWIFGNNIEEELGHIRYLFFYLASGVAATLAHVALNLTSTIPIVGASGAIAGVMGAYLVLHPRARVTSIIPPLFFLPFRVPAAVFLVIWFLGQFALAGGDTNIAWEAHVGGFVVGALYAWRVRRSRQEVE